MAGGTDTVTTSIQQPASTPTSSLTKPSISAVPNQVNTAGATPTPTQTGVATGCKKWHMVVKGDGCPEIAKRYGVDVEDFKKWNPAVKADCTLLETGFNVCVEA